MRLTNRSVASCSWGLVIRRIIKPDDRISGAGIEISRAGAILMDEFVDALSMASILCWVGDAFNQQLDLPDVKFQGVAVVMVFFR